MSDTIQAVRWWFATTANEPKYMLPPTTSSKGSITLIHDAVHRLELGAEVEALFQHTQPLWYGLWINSPLNSAQCRLLSRLFAEIAVEALRFRDNLQEFVSALHKAEQNRELLSVELLPPGHVDMGWSTTFVHCPRCKAEGPFERWKSGAYPTEAINCPTCGFSYSPAATFSAEREYFATAVNCSHCGTSQRIKELAEEERESLEHQHCFLEFLGELHWLKRVAAFYDRYPDMKGKVRSPIDRILRSTNSAAQPRSSKESSLDDFAHPSVKDPVESRRAWTPEDLEVIDYLQHNYFSLEARLKFVQESIWSYKAKRIPPVNCRSCGKPLLSGTKS